MTGGAEWEEESGLSQGGDLGWGWAWLTLENGFLHCFVLVFFFSFKIKVERKALRQVSGLCCCP